MNDEYDDDRLVEIENRIDALRRASMEVREPEAVAEADRELQEALLDLEDGES